MQSSVAPASFTLVDAQSAADIKRIAERLQADNVVTVGKYGQHAQQIISQAWMNPMDGEHVCYFDDNTISSIRNEGRKWQLVFLSRTSRYITALKRRVEPHLDEMAIILLFNLSPACVKYFEKAQHVHRVERLAKTNLYIIGYSRTGCLSDHLLKVFPSHE